MTRNKSKDLFRSQLSAVNDVNRFYISILKIHGVPISNEFGELVEGGFSYCLNCHHIMWGWRVAIFRWKVSTILVFLLCLLTYPNLMIEKNPHIKNWIKQISQWYCYLQSSKFSIEQKSLFASAKEKVWWCGHGIKIWELSRWWWWSKKVCQ